MREALAKACAAALPRARPARGRRADERRGRAGGSTRSAAPSPPTRARSACAAAGSGTASASSQQRALGRGAFLLSSSELAALAHLPGAAGAARAGAGRRAQRAAARRPARAGQAARCRRARRRRSCSRSPTRATTCTCSARPGSASRRCSRGSRSTTSLAGRGAVVVDPKGDLVEDLLARIPDGLEQRVDLLDPLDPAPPGLNVLEGEDADLVTDQLVGIFRRVYEQFWGPRTDDILRAAPADAARDGPGATLADVRASSPTTRWREQLSAELDDPVGLEPFWEWYERLSAKPMRAQATGPVLNKLRAFLLRRPVRAIVGQPRSSVDVARVLDQGRLLLVRVPKGTLGEDTSRLLGSFVVARVWQAALARAAPRRRRAARVRALRRRGAELPNLPTPLADMLAEARGYQALALPRPPAPRPAAEARCARRSPPTRAPSSTSSSHSKTRSAGAARSSPNSSAHDLAQPTALHRRRPALPRRRERAGVHAHDRAAPARRSRTGRARCAPTRARGTASSAPGSKPRLARRGRRSRRRSRRMTRPSAHRSGLCSALCIRLVIRLGPDPLQARAFAARHVGPRRRFASRDYPGENQ